MPGRGGRDLPVQGQGVPGAGQASSWTLHVAVMNRINNCQSYFWICLIAGSFLTYHYKLLTYVGIYTEHNRYVPNLNKNQTKTKQKQYLPVASSLSLIRHRFALYLMKTRTSWKYLQQKDDLACIIRKVPEKLACRFYHTPS